MPSSRDRLGQGVKVAAALADRVRPPQPGVTVLIYHRVGARSGVAVDLPTSQFDEQLTILGERFSVVSLDDALAALDGPPPTDPRPMVALTFDDGTADFVDDALPVIERHQMPVTLYAATGFIDEQLPFPDDGLPLSWSALCDAASTGLVDVGSHTHRHLLLDRLAPDEVAEELDRSIELIAQHVGRAPRHFAYPKAVLGSPEARRAIRARFTSAAVAGTRPNRFGATDRYALARSPIQVRDGLRWFEAKAAGGLAFEDTLRRALNRRRYAEAVS